mmetsp:Transcript_80147/g.120460  ORF Transcript_80147/g.120460 Transcript_80147/m.120460 type:complete len:265 (+) Transcript_80147:142-936(+)
MKLKKQTGKKMDGVDCDANLGIRYAYKGSGPSKSTPLTIYFTAGGQVAGVGVNLYGAGSAPQNLIDLGFWIPIEGEKNQWMLSVSFRQPSDMCSHTTVDEVIGDRLVINQNTLSYSLPLTAAEAFCNNWTYGSCMTTMGQHWFYDVSGAPDLTWNSANLLPVVTMYYPPNINGTINAFFFTTPVAQPGSDYLLHKPGDWETPDLSPSQMCENFCNSTCTWPGVDDWSTMHIYLNSQWSYITCDGGHGLLSIYCPTNDSSMITQC